MKFAPGPRGPYPHRVENSCSKASGLKFLRARSAASCHKIILSMAAKQGIQLIFQIADGESIGRRAIHLNQRGL